MMNIEALQIFFQSLPVERQTEINVLYARHTAASHRIGVPPSTPFEFLRDCYQALQAGPEALKPLVDDTPKNYESRDYMRQAEGIE